MLKSEMTCSLCIYGEPCGSFGAVKCIRHPESVMKRGEEYCGDGWWYSQKDADVYWGEWEEEEC